MNEKDRQIEWLKNHLQLELQDIFRFNNMNGNKSYKGKLIGTESRLKYMLTNLELWIEQGIIPDEIDT